MSITGADAERGRANRWRNWRVQQIVQQIRALDERGELDAKATETITAALAVGERKA
jgi:hypothetical protein